MTQDIRTLLDTSCLIKPDWSVSIPGIQALSTTRLGGVSTGVYGCTDGNGGLNLGMHVGDSPFSVNVNRQRLNQCLPTPVGFLSQVHGTMVVSASEYRENIEADAIICNQSGFVCAVQTADCLPVLFADTAGKVVGAAHAGWRGLAAGVLESTVEKMRKAGAGEICAWLGPAIGAAQFEVGSDVFNAFTENQAAAAHYFRKKDSTGKYLADIYGLARDRLKHIGISLVTGGEYCTVSQPDLFYSYRRDRVTGRMASLIWINPV